MKTNLSIYILTGIAFTALFLGSCRKEKIKPEQADTFIKYYGKGGTQTAGNVALTSDGGYILVGTSDSYGQGKDILVVKTDKYGNEEWSKVFGGAGDDEGNWIQVTSNGNYVIAGTRSESNGTNTDANILYLGSDGSVLFDSIYGKSGQDETARHAIPTLDNGFISIGTYTDTSKTANPKQSIYLVKTIASGNHEWYATYGNTNSQNIGTSIRQLSDSIYYSSATTIKSGTGDMLATKGRLQKNPFFYNSNSNITKTNFNSAIKDAADILIEPNGDKYILGSTNGGQIYILGVSDQELQLFYNATGTAAKASSFSRVNDGGFIIAGYTTDTNNGQSDILIIRTDSKGNQIWTKTLGGTGSDYGTSVVQTADGGFVVSATIQFGGDGTGANAVISLIRLNGDGELK